MGVAIAFEGGEGRTEGGGGEGVGRIEGEGEGVIGCC